jgi:hypothetical protein
LDRRPRRSTFKILLTGGNRSILSRPPLGPRKNVRSQRSHPCHYHSDIKTFLFYRYLEQSATFGGTLMSSVTNHHPSDVYGRRQERHMREHCLAKRTQIVDKKSGLIGISARA